MILFLFVLCFWIPLHAMDLKNMQNSGVIDGIGILTQNNPFQNNNDQQMMYQNSYPYQHQYQCQNCQIIGDYFQKTQEYKETSEAKISELENEIQSMQKKMEDLDKDREKEKREIRLFEEKELVRNKELEKKLFLQEEKVKNLEDTIKQQEPCKGISSFCDRIFTYLSKDDFKNSEKLARRAMLLIVPFILIPLFMRNWEKECTGNIFNACSELSKFSKKEDFERLIMQAINNAENVIEGCRLGTLLLSGFSFFVGFHWW